MQYEGKKYHATKDTARAVLEKYGVAIVLDVLTPEECVKMASGMWDFIEYTTSKFSEPLCPVKRDSPETWKHFFQLLPSHSMLLKHFGVGHSPVMWWLRQHQSVRDVFAALWSTSPDELAVGYDGFSFQMPPEVVSRGHHNPARGWLHCDQSPKKKGRRCFQSWVTACDVAEGDATLLLLEGSHLLHDQLVSDKSDDFYRITDADRELFDRSGCTKVRIVAPAGSMVIWDSRTVHEGAQAERGRASQNFRMVAYLSFLPRCHITRSQAAKMIENFLNGRTTTHWAYPQKVCGLTPQTYGASLPPLPEPLRPVLSEVGRALVGLGRPLPEPPRKRARKS